MLKFNLLLLLIFYNLIQVDSAQDITVRTRYGQIRGQVHTLHENKDKIDVFYGIPFARAKRFEVIFIGIFIFIYKLNFFNRISTK